MNCILFYQQECIECTEFDTTKLDIPSDSKHPTPKFTVHLAADDLRATHILHIFKHRTERDSCMPARGHPTSCTIHAGILDLGFGKARIEKIHSDGIDLTFYLAHTKETQRHTSSVLLAHPRPPVMKRLLRDLASMGLDALYCYIPDLGEKSYLNSSLWNESNTLMLLGAMQGKRCNLPRLHSTVGLGNALALLESHLQEEVGQTVFIPVELRQAADISLQALLQTLHKKEIDPKATTQQKHEKEQAQSEVVFPHLHAVFLESQSVASAPAVSSSSTGKQKANTQTHFIYFIGPERQYSDKEIALLESLPLYRAHLGTQTLRSEIATVLVQGMWNMYMGEM